MLEKEKKKLFKGLNLKDISLIVNKEIKFKKKDIEIFDTLDNDSG
jgi:hypothetical protein